MTSHDLRLIAFYLPQFHPIPENDEWWGTGFTEWTNVTKARPRFDGHYQPHLPSDLGFYDLRLEETRIAQAELAKEHGIHGFCYYHYWFNGKMLLERPFNEVLRTGKPDFPFCLCWANENWTRRWDGLDAEVLIGQDYENYQVDQHFEWLGAAFADPRYIKVDNKPLYLVYRADHLPNLAKTVEQMREAVHRQGLKGLYLCAVKNTQFSLSDEEAINAGFDALIDFQPNSMQIPLMPRKSPSLKEKILHRLRLITKVQPQNTSNCNQISYKGFIETVMTARPTEHKTFPCVFPSWDNSARRNEGATIIQNTDAELFQKFLFSASEKVLNYPEQEQLVFINAWNEWAEGCHLEPDLRNGRNFLEAVKSLSNTGGNK
jgi:lipopolysaccharide biosynthesis protein